METFILDTNIILSDASSIFKFGHSTVVIPSTVLEELDKKKRQMDDVGKNAREFSRFYKKVRKEHKTSLFTGVPLHSGGTFRIEFDYKSSVVDEMFGDPSNDNKILATAFGLSEKNPSEMFTLVSNDILMIAKADKLTEKSKHGNFLADMYENDRLVDDSQYTHKGSYEVFVPVDLINQAYKEEGVPFESVESYLEDVKKEMVCLNDFFILKGQTNPNSSFIGRLIQCPKKHTRILQQMRKFKEPIKGISPKNVQQQMLLDALLDQNISVVSAIGKAGTGKTLLALLAGLMGTETNRFKKMLVGRPVVPMGKDIGYLPGEKNEKLRPWMQPIYDNLEFILGSSTEGKNKQTIDDIVNSMTNIEIEALTYIRGRSIPDQFIIIDEAQNLSPHEVKTIITRAGERTKIVLCGDPDQIDHPYLDPINNGLTFATERMKQEAFTAVVHLAKSERSLLAERAADLLK